MNHITDIGANHWMTNMLRPHIDHITKLTFKNCTFDRQVIFSMHQITHLKIIYTHTSFEKVFRNSDLLKCRTLEKLVTHRLHISDETLKEVARNNPRLHSIIVNRLGLKLFQENSIWERVTRFKKVGVVKLDKNSHISPDSMDRIVHTLRNLESLVVSKPSANIEQFQRLGIECKRIKRLTFDGNDIHLWDDRMIDAVRSFQQIKFLNLHNDCRGIDKIKLAVEGLPNLRHLRFDILNANFPFADTVPLLRECPSLETITVSFNDMHIKFICTQFFNEFLETIAAIGKSNARIEIEKLGKIVATMSQYGIVCRKKLIHWMDCDNIPKSSDTHLLKLANVLVKSGMKRERSQEVKQRHLLDRIFDYLDVTSLYLFAETSPQSKQLVENFIKMHSQQNGLFTITNEFHPFRNYRRIHKMFVPYVTYLKVHNFEEHDDSDFPEKYLFVTNISIFDEIITSWGFPKSLRHLTLDGSEFIDPSELCKILGGLKGIDTMELRNASSVNGFEHMYGCFKDSQVKTIKFHYRDETQLDHLKKMFEVSKTKLAPIFPNYS